MLLADTLPLAHRLGCSTMSMLRGAEEHKMRWRPAESQNQRILLARPGSLRGAAYATGRARLPRRGADRQGPGAVAAHRSATGWACDRLRWPR